MVLCTLDLQGIAMNRFYTFTLLAVTLTGCNSDEFSSDTFTAEASTQVVSVSGGEIPAEADLAIVWYKPDNSDFDSYVTGGGSLSNGTFLVEPPDPIPLAAISDNYGVATGLILAFPKDEAPVTGPYNESQPDESDYFDKAIGVVNNHAIIYRHGNPNPILFPDPIDWWGTRFSNGYSCARSIRVEGDFDQFAPTDCSAMILTIGIISEIEIVGGDWY